MATAKHDESRDELTAHVLNRLSDGECPALNGSRERLLDVVEGEVKTTKKQRDTRKLLPWWRRLFSFS